MGLGSMGFPSGRPGFREFSRRIGLGVSECVFGSLGPGVFQDFCTSLLSRHFLFHGRRPAHERSSLHNFL